MKNITTAQKMSFLLIAVFGIIAYLVIDHFRQEEKQREAIASAIKAAHITAKAETSDKGSTEEKPATDDKAGVDEAEENPNGTKKIL